MCACTQKHPHFCLCMIKQHDVLKYCVSIIHTTICNILQHLFKQSGGEWKGGILCFGDNMKIKLICVAHLNTVNIYRLNKS